MTAILAARRSDGVVLMTDAAHYDADGTVHMIAPKTLVWPHAPAALGFRGAREFMRGLLSYTTEAVSFDALLDVLPTAARVAHDFAVRERLGAESKGEMIIGGWSQRRRGPILASLWTYEAEYVAHDGEHITAAPFTVVESESPYIVTVPPQEIADEFGLALPEDPDQFSTEQGLRWLQALRRWPVLGFHAVGGYAHVTTIGRDGLTSGIVHRWPDQVGQLISPV